MKFWKDPTVRPYSAVKPLPVILLWVRLRLHRWGRRAKCPRAVSVMPTLCAKEREVREGMREMTPTPTSVTRPPQTSRDSSFCSLLHGTHMLKAVMHKICNSGKDSSS